MLQTIARDQIRQVIANNAEPFANEGGLGTQPRHAGEVPVDAPGELVLETDYGRLWSWNFAARHTGLLAGPCQPVMERFANHGFLAVPFRLVPRVRAETAAELRNAIANVTMAAVKIYPKRVIVLRGQTREHVIERDAAEREYLFGTTDAPEPSLRPSSARRAPLDEIAAAVWAMLVQRHLADAGTYEAAHRVQSTGTAWPHASRLGTLINLAYAQHYGLPTPALDVTNDPAVALWFALHTMVGTGPNASVAKPAADDGDDGVIYVIAADPSQHFDHELTGEHALRPLRQRGGFVASNWGHSKNRTARYLAAAIYFPHMVLPGLSADVPTSEHLFPGPSEDPFVATLQATARRFRRGSAALQQISDHVYWVHAPHRDPDIADLERRADQGELVAMVFLGQVRRDEGDRAGAERWWREVAARDAQHALAAGWAFWSNGDDDGATLTRLAAEAGAVEAYNNLGLMSRDRGDLTAAEQHFRTAAEAGGVIAAYHLGGILIRSGRHDEAEHWLRQSAEGGDMDAAANLGALFVQRRTDDAAEPWLRRAAEADQVEAAYNLGRLRERAGDDAEALAWFRKAAELGDPDAPYDVRRLLGDEAPSAT